MISFTIARMKDTKDINREMNPSTTHLRCKYIPCIVLKVCYRELHFKVILSRVSEFCILQITEIDLNMKLWTRGFGPPIFSSEETQVEFLHQFICANYYNKLFFCVQF